MKDRNVYRIMGTYRGKTEIVDRATGLQSARYLLGEYRLAFGPSWKLWIADSRGKEPAPC